MKHILLLAVICVLAFAVPAARLEKRAADRPEVKARPDDVPGATIQGDTAIAKAGYLFAQESGNSVSVIKTGGKIGVRLQTGTLTCISPDNSTCNAFVGGGGTVAMCKGVHRGCHFVGVRGGVRAP